MYLLTGLRVIGSLSFPDTPTTARGKAKGDSSCRKKQQTCYKCIKRIPSQ